MEYLEDIFSGSPENKFFEVLHTANRGVIEGELREFFKEFLVLEAKSEGEELDTLSEEFEGRMNNLYIDLAYKIIRQCE